MHWSVEVVKFVSWLIVAGCVGYSLGKASQTSDSLKRIADYLDCIYSRLAKLEGKM